MLRMRIDGVFAICLLDHGGVVTMAFHTYVVITNLNNFVIRSVAVLAFHSSCHVAISEEFSRLRSGCR